MFNSVKLPLKIIVIFLVFITNGKDDFLDLLRWMQVTLSDHSFDPLLRTHPHISERIRNIEALDDEKVIETPMLKAHLTPHQNFK